MTRLLLLVLSATLTGCATARPVCASREFLYTRVREHGRVTDRTAVYRCTTTGRIVTVAVSDAP